MNKSEYKTLSFKIPTCCGAVGAGVLLFAEALLVDAIADAHENDEDYNGHYYKHADAQLKVERDSLRVLE